MGKRYSTEEDLVLNSYWFTEGSVGCRKRLPHRTILSLQARAYKLGIKGNWGGFEDLTGNYFVDWKVLKRGPNYSSPEGNHKICWWCECKCGAIKLVVSYSLTSGASTCCGDCNPIILGKRYNNWVEPIEFVEDYIEPTSGEHYKQVKCICHYDRKNCKKVFITRIASIKSGNTNSCGCLHKEKMIKTFTGDTNPNWKGGITEFSHIIRECFKNNTWKDTCRERDNYICQKCDKRGEKTHVHHIKFFTTMLDELVKLGITDLKDIPDVSEFWDVDNGATLCTDCHKETHRVFKNSCTRKEFEKWLNQPIDNQK